jgi:transcriptional regulator with XRE-family HTH domain
VAARDQVVEQDALMSGISRLSKAFAEIVREQRGRKGLSQEALAEAADIHHTYVGLLERGKRVPTLQVAERIANALGRKLSSLVEEAERRSRH